MMGVCFACAAEGCAEDHGYGGYGAAAVEAQVFLAAVGARCQRRCVAAADSDPGR